VRSELTGQRRRSSFRDGKVISGGVLSMAWFLKRNPLFTGIEMEFWLNKMADLSRAASSETLFPEASAIRKAF
jgi:hypothetical protein